MSGIAQNLALSTSMHMAIRIRAYMIHRCFQQILFRGTSKEKKTSSTSSTTASAEPTDSVGAALALICNDSQRWVDAAPSLHQVWAAPLLIGLSANFLIRLLSPLPALSLLCVLGASAPCGFLWSSCLVRIRTRRTAITEKRLRLCDEVLNGIRIVKYFCWERPYFDKIKALREKEVKEALYQNSIFASTATQIVCMPFLAQAICLLLYVYVTGGKQMVAS
eukprot:GSA25T00022992001.1